MGRPGFILQHVVDAYTAQTASDGSKPMGVIFALVGLYLHVERQFSGGEVQKVHMQLGRQKRQWPAITLPRDRGSMTAADVLVASEGRARDHAIDEWCRSVWTAFCDSRQTIVDLLRQYQIFIDSLDKHMLRGLLKIVNRVCCASVATINEGVADGAINDVNESHDVAAHGRGGSPSVTGERERRR